jgi:hypothetical protein
MPARRPKSKFAFETMVIEWRGPAPFYYAPVPAEHAADIHALRKLVTYGWGMVPVEATIGGVTFTTSLFPKNGTYLLPLKDAVRRRAGITADDSVAVKMTVQSAALGREPNPG